MLHVFRFACETNLLQRYLITIQPLVLFNATINCATSVAICSINGLFFLCLVCSDRFQNVADAILTHKVDCNLDCQPLLLFFSVCCTEQK